MTESLTRSELAAAIREVLNAGTNGARDALKRVANKLDPPVAAADPIVPAPEPALAPTRLKVGGYALVNEEGAVVKLLLRLPDYSYGLSGERLPFWRCEYIFGDAKGKHADLYEGRGWLLPLPDMPTPEQIGPGVELTGEVRVPTEDELNKRLWCAAGSGRIICACAAPPRADRDPYDGRRWILRETAPSHGIVAGQWREGPSGAYEVLEATEYEVQIRYYGGVDYAWTSCDVAADPIIPSPPALPDDAKGGKLEWRLPKLGERAWDDLKCEWFAANREFRHIKVWVLAPSGIAWLRSWRPGTVGVGPDAVYVRQPDFVYEIASDNIVAMHDGESGCGSPSIAALTPQTCRIVEGGAA